MTPATSFLAGKRVLIIEDREENRRLLRAILKLEGPLTLEASDGARALPSRRGNCPTWC